MMATGRQPGKDGVWAIVKRTLPTGTGNLEVFEYGP
jgi:hypothetical protein